jgi:hypothetical protein
VDVKIFSDSEDALPPVVRKCTVVTAHDDPRNVAGEAPTNPRADQAALVHELIEALTALGNYLAAAQRQLEPPGEVLGAALRASLGQYERAVECLRRLHDFVLREGSKNDDPSRNY